LNFFEFLKNNGERRDSFIMHRFQRKKKEGVVGERREKERKMVAISLHTTVPGERKKDERMKRKEGERNIYFALLISPSVIK